MFVSNVYLFFVFFVYSSIFIHTLVYFRRNLIMHQCEWSSFRSQSFIMTHVNKKFTFLILRICYFDTLFIYIYIYIHKYIYSRKNYCINVNGHHFDRTIFHYLYVYINKNNYLFSIFFIYSVTLQM